LEFFSFEVYILTISASMKIVELNFDQIYDLSFFFTTKTYYSLNGIFTEIWISWNQLS